MRSVSDWFGFLCIGLAAGFIAFTMGLPLWATLLAITLIYVASDQR